MVYITWMVIGILAENQASAEIIGMPFFMVIFLAGTLAKMNNIAGMAANFLPNYNMQVLPGRIFTNEPLNINFAYNILVILLWIIIGAGIFVYAYKKKTDSIISLF